MAEVQITLQYDYRKPLGMVRINLEAIPMDKIDWSRLVLAPAYDDAGELLAFGLIEKEHLK